VTIIDRDMFGNDHHHSMKTLASFLVVVFAFALFAVLYGNASEIITPENITYLMLLVGVLFAFLLGLVYFINQPNPHAAKAKKSSKKKSR
jgi:ATP/ADP translocase